MFSTSHLVVSVQGLQRLDLGSVHNVYSGYRVAQIFGLVCNIREEASSPLRLYGLLLPFHSLEMCMCRFYATACLLCIKVCDQSVSKFYQVYFSAGVLPRSWREGIDISNPLRFHEHSLGWKPSNRAHHTWAWNSLSKPCHFCVRHRYKKGRMWTLGAALESLQILYLWNQLDSQAQSSLRTLQLGLRAPSPHPSHHETHALAGCDPLQTIMIAVVER